jgi:hypothetical protein
MERSIRVFLFEYCYHTEIIPICDNYCVQNVIVAKQSFILVLEESHGESPYFSLSSSINNESSPE